MIKFNKQKKEKDGSFKNFIFAAKLIFKVAPKIIPCTLLSMFCSELYSDFIRNVLFLKKLLDLITSGADFGEFVKWLVIFCIAGIVATFFDNFGDYYASCEYKTIYKKINELIFKKASEVDAECFENPEFFSIYKRATELVSESYYNNFVWCLSEVIVKTIIGIILVTYLISVDARTLILVVPCFAVFMLAVMKNKLSFNRDMEMTRNKRVKDYVQRVVYLKDYSKDVRTSDIYGILKNKLSTAVANNIEIYKKYGGRIAFVYFLSQFFGEAVPIGGAFAYGAYSYGVKHSIPISDFSVLMTAITGIKNTVTNVSRYAGYLHNTLLYFGNLKKFLDFENKMPSGELQTEKFDTIEFKNVSFTYPGAKKPSLKNISFKLNRGETIAVVGQNGAGKSTFVKLLLRFYDPDEGEILYNGVNLKKYDIESYRKRIGTVFQDYKMFALTVNENVLCREVENDNDLKKVKNALCSSGVYERVEELPKKSDSVLTKEFDENGVVLSGGEQQKIAAARMFANAFDLAVLDEPSSALDPIAEYRMYESLISNTKDKTVIYISHRLSSAVLADRIYVFADGAVCEEGTHEQLLQKDGVYGKMFKMQASSYKKETEVSKV